MNISGPFIKRPIGTTLLAAGMAVCGIICYFLLGVAALPNMEFPAIFVTANQPGASADSDGANNTRSYGRLAAK